MGKEGRGGEGREEGKGMEGKGHPTFENRSPSLLVMSLSLSFYTETAAVEAFKYLPPVYFYQSLSAPFKMSIVINSYRLLIGNRLLVIL